MNKLYEQDPSKAPELSTLLGWYEFCKEASRKKHWEYFVIDQFLKGNHNVRGNPEDNSIVVTKKSSNVNFPINKIYSTFRAVRGFVTRHKPVAQVEVTQSTDEAKTYARRAGKILERDNQLNNARKLNKEWVYFGVKYGVGWRQIGYDPVKKCAIRWTIDPFDLLIGSKTGKAQDAPYIIKTFTRTMAYWKNKYPKAEVVPDNEVAASEYKKLAIQIEFQDTSSSGLNYDEQTAIGMECWYKVFKPNKNGGLINKCLFTKTGIVDFQETPYTEYPFIPYEAEILPNDPAPDGHIKHLIAPQRLLNLLNTQLLEYNHIVNRGRFSMEKNSGFKVVNAQEGQIIMHNPGKRLEVMSPPPLNPALMRQIDYAENWIEDIGGQHDASRGTAPSGITSGVAIENLQIGDSNNISDLRDNFEDALSMEATWILKMYSLFEKDGVVVEDQVKEGEVDQFATVGLGAIAKSGGSVPDKYFIEENGNYCDVCAILPDNMVKVSITSELGETKAARLEVLLKLLDYKVIPATTVLKYLEFPNASDISERLAEELAAEIATNQMQQPMQPPQPGMPMGDINQAPMPPVPPQGGGDAEALQQLRAQAEGMLSNG